MDTKKITKDEPAIANGFISTLQTHQKGSVITDVSEAMQNVTAAVREHSKPGKVVLTMTIYPATKGNESALGFECDVVEKLPRGESYAGLFFADDHNNLVRENPQQPPLTNLRAIGHEDEEQEHREATRKANEI